MSAIISACGTYRYQLYRQVSLFPWVSCVVFLMLNPSTADETEDDATIRRCMAFARRLGHTRLIVLNLFALRSRDPKKLATHPDPIGPENDDYLKAIHRDVPIIAAWGSASVASARAIQVRNLLGDRKIFCLGTCASGAPRHPLYLPSSATLRLWSEQ